MRYKKCRHMSDAMDKMQKKKKKNYSVLFKCFSEEMIFIKSANYFIENFKLRTYKSITFYGTFS